MDLKQLKDKWSELVIKFNKAGIPLPVLRDPASQEGSVSLTLVFISFNLCVAGLVGKWSGKLGGIDVGQSLNLFLACAGLYWGRRIGKDDKKIDIGGKDDIKSSTQDQ